LFDGRSGGHWPYHQPRDETLIVAYARMVIACLRAGEIAQSGGCWAARFRQLWTRRRKCNSVQRPMRLFT
jgi:hypothetical protein